MTEGGRSRASHPFHGPIELQSETVEYPDRPDRTTVYPPDLSRDARTTTWLTVDNHILVRLDEVR
jgi:hypothetical protein